MLLKFHRSSFKAKSHQYRSSCPPCKNSGFSPIHIQCRDPIFFLSAIHIAKLHYLTPPKPNTKLKRRAINIQCYFQTKRHDQLIEISKCATPSITDLENALSFPNRYQSIVCAKDANFTTMGQCLFTPGDGILICVKTMMPLMLRLSGLMNKCR